MSYGFARIEMWPFLSLLLVLIFVIKVNCGSLEDVDDDYLLTLIRTEKYVVVLFTKKDCEECNQLENETLKMREDIVDSLSAWVVKVHNSQLVRLYSPNKEPALVFFRHGVPLLYDGPVNDELILNTFMENKEPTVRELTDDNFESLTQSASGATTGDWFVMFYATDCVDCQRLGARLEAVGARLKTRMNVARVNRQTTGQVTARRFRVFETPTFILFRHGKMYYYNLPKYDVATFVTFATEWYKNARSEKVPVPKTPFDDFTQQIADYLHQNPWVWKIGSFFVCIVLLGSFLAKLKSQEKKEKKKASAGKKTKTEKSEKEKVKKSK